MKRKHTAIVDQQKRLLNLRLLEEIDSDTYAEKATELRDEETKLRLKLEGSARERYEIADIAVKAFELSQELRAQWFKADYAAKRRILEILCLNVSLDGVSLSATMRKPFDMLAEGLVWKDSRGDSRCTFVNETDGSWLVLMLFPQILEFQGDALLKYVEPGLYSKRR